MAASREAAAEFERRFVERVRSYVTEPWSGYDHRAGRSSRSKRTWWTWFVADEVAIRGSFPNTEVLVVGAGLHDDTCRFGFVLPIWFEGGRASWDIARDWQPEWGTEAAQMLCYNVFEENDVPVRPPCVPDENGITWVEVGT